jgi:hypothetical protein
MVSILDFTNASPNPSSMIETFRAIGYSMEAAVADILDNSISAGAKNIWVDFEWKGSETWLSIRDDGAGMDGEQLVQAMRPGSKNPTESRDARDLGRFGLGLKTASFSQCRRLTVLSKTKQSQADYWTWNLDYVRETGEWNLIKMDPDQPQLDWLDTRESGSGPGQISCRAKKSKKPSGDCISPVYRIRQVENIFSGPSCGSLGSLS